MKLEQSTLIFEALGQINRLKIFRILVENSHDGITPTEISKKMKNMPRNTLSFHLSLLSQANLCTSKKVGKEIIYRPVCATIKKIAHFLLKDCCDGELSC